MKTKRILVMGAMLSLAAACGEDEADGMSSTDETDGGESGATEDTGDGQCEETRVEPVGCEGIEFPGDETPRTVGVVRAEDHGLFSSGPREIIEFHDADGPACGDICPCEDEAFTLLLHNNFEGPGVFELGGGEESESPAELWELEPGDYHADINLCGYEREQPSSGQVEILNVGETCIAGILSDLPAPFDVLNGAFMAGSCA